MLNSLSELTEYLKSRKIGIGAGKMRYKGQRVGTVQCEGENVVCIQVFTQFDNYFRDLLDAQPDGIRGVAESQVTCNNCPRCIDGKCSVTGIKLSPGDAESEEFAKRLIELRCEAIDNDRVPKCNYIKLSDRDRRVPCNKCAKCNPSCRSLKNF